MKLIRAIMFFLALAFIVVNVYLIYEGLTGPKDPVSQSLSLCESECLVFDENFTGITQDGCRCICETKSINICQDPPRVTEMII